jgi:hypothetical protein
MYGLIVFDVSDPLSPAISGTAIVSTARAIDVAGSYAYVADIAGLRVIDISSPSSPTITGGVDTPGEATGVAVGGSYAYVADGEPGLQIVDISEPALPVIVGNAATFDEAVGVAVDGGVAYVADSRSGMQVIDISDPSLPTVIGCSGMSGAWDAYTVDVAGNYAYLAAGYAKFSIFPVQCESTTDVLAGGPAPARAMLRVRPHPIRGNAVIEWQGDGDAPASLKLYGPEGRLLRTRDVWGAGVRRVRWRDLVGDTGLASGIYFLRLSVAGERRPAVRVVVTE